VSLECVECGQTEPDMMTTCTYCGEDVCYDDIDDHEQECEDGDE
jgi:hypothetical protein